MATAFPSIPKSQRASSHELKAEWSEEVKNTIRSGVPDAIKALCHEAKHAKNSQARVAAARQVVRLAFVMGVLERDAMKDWLSEIGSELEKLGV